MQISENMMARQETVSLQDVLNQVFKNEDSECETLTNGAWQPS